MLTNESLYSNPTNLNSNLISNWPCFNTNLGARILTKEKNARFIFTSETKIQKFNGLSHFVIKYMNIENDSKATQMFGNFSKSEENEPSIDLAE